MASPCALFRARAQQLLLSDPNPAVRVGNAMRGEGMGRGLRDAVKTNTAARVKM